VSFRTSACLLPQQFRLVLTSFLHVSGLAFAKVLAEDDIQQACDEEGIDFGQATADDGQQVVYTPAVTLWAFLSQVLFKDEQRSCLAATSRVVVFMAALEVRISDNTGQYCRARAKLSESFLRRLTLKVAHDCEKAIPKRWLWRNRHVYLADGTTVSMPDTEENQEAYPQHGTQKKGVGFPIARMVVLLSLATAMVTDMALGPYQGKETGEPALLRELLDQLGAGDILLADRCYCSYFLIALLRRIGADVVTRLHQMRTANFRRGRRLGKGDHVVRWPRPDKPDWMDDATYDSMPEFLEVREVQVHVDQPGFRTESFVAVTTLLDAKKYQQQDIAELYHQRWLAELDIRAIKIQLGMDVLRCQSPEMVRREIWTCLLAYNLIRKTILESAKRSKLSPRQISFTAALQKVAASWQAVLLLSGVSLEVLLEADFEHIAAHRVGHRPDRVEPRKVKRRPKSHKLLTEPREAAREQLLSGKA
jgi:putative transposase